MGTSYTDLRLRKTALVAWIMLLVAAIAQTKAAVEAAQPAIQTSKPGPGQGGSSRKLLCGFLWCSRPAAPTVIIIPAPSGVCL